MLLSRVCFALQFLTPTYYLPVCLSLSVFIHVPSAEREHGGL